MFVIFSVVLLVAMVAALVDIVRRDGSEIKGLPKIMWVLLVVFVPLIGVVLWFTLGRDYTSSARSGSMSFGDPRRWAKQAQNPAIEQAPAAWRDTRTTEQQLADLDREIEQYRENPPGAQGA